MGRGTWILSWEWLLVIITKFTVLLSPDNPDSCDLVQDRLSRIQNHCSLQHFGFGLMGMTRPMMGLCSSSGNSHVCENIHCQKHWKSPLPFSAGGEELDIGISQFASYQGSDVKVQIGDLWPQIQAQTDRGVNVTLPALPAGWYNISVLINGIAVASNRWVFSLEASFSLLFGVLGLIWKGRFEFFINSVPNGEFCSVVWNYE